MTYTYDGDGERVKKSTGTLYYAGSGTDALSEANASGAIVADYIFFGGKRIARIDNPGATETVHYYLSDHLGTHDVIASVTGAFEKETMFFPYGGERWSTGTDSNHYKFTGKERDSETGLDYFGARYYSSTMSRFMTPDWADKPITVPYAEFGDPQSLNLYGYVRNNPQLLIDGDGHAINYASNLKNSQLVKDTIQAILADPEMGPNLSRYVGTGPDTPNLTIQNGDLSNGDRAIITPEGQIVRETVQGDTNATITTTKFEHTGMDGKTTTSTETKLNETTITIDNRTSKDQTIGVIIHETTHGGEAAANPAKYNKDREAEKALPYHQRPQEQRADGMQQKRTDDIKKAVEKIEQDRKKD